MSWYGSSISIIIYLSLIRGIFSVADGENGRLGSIATVWVPLGSGSSRGMPTLCSIGVRYFYIYAKEGPES